MLQRVWLAQLWAEDSLGVLARSRTLYEEIAYLVGRGDLPRTLAILPLCFSQPVKNHVDAYLKVWSYIRPHADAADAAAFFRLLQERAPGLNQHLYRLVLRHGLWYLYNSRLFLTNACPDRLWVPHSDQMSLVTFERGGPTSLAWLHVAEELSALADARALATRAESDLVLLRVGEELIWNPKLDGLPGAAALVTRLRSAGVALSVARLARRAEG